MRDREQRVSQLVGGGHAVEPIHIRQIRRGLVWDEHSVDRVVSGRVRLTG